MLSCREVAELHLKSESEPTPFMKRIKIKMHVLMCKVCKAQMANMKFLSEVFMGIHEFDTEPRLNEEARARIGEKLKKENL